MVFHCSKNGKRINKIVFFEMNKFDPPLLLGTRAAYSGVRGRTRPSAPRSSVPPRGPAEPPARASVPVAPPAIAARQHGTLERERATRRPVGQPGPPRGHAMGRGRCDLAYTHRRLAPWAPRPASHWSVPASRGDLWRPLGQAIPPQRPDVA